MITTRRKFTKGITLGASGAASRLPLLRQMEAHAAGRTRTASRRRFRLRRQIQRHHARRDPPGGPRYRRRRPSPRPPAHRPSAPANAAIARSLQRGHDDSRRSCPAANFGGNHSSYYGALSCHHSPEKARGGHPRLPPRPAQSRSLQKLRLSPPTATASATTTARSSRTPPSSQRSRPTDRTARCPTRPAPKKPTANCSAAPSI